MQYRTDIAGLRALAVLPILFVHAGMTAIPGGFVGVDIFFVISGYLITRIILKEMDGGSFSVAGFYRRRALRILPALLVMLAVTLAVGWWRLFPGDLRSLGWSTTAAALSGSNFWFWRTVNYFGDADLIPLLHTWSLGVEEQFYIFHPLLLLALRRWWPRGIVPMLWIIFAGSLAIGFALIAVNKAPAAFYLLPPRAWELALGGLIAAGGFPAVAPRWRGMVAATGLVMVIASLFVITPDSAFPAPWALLPCIGTALLIAYGEAAPTARLLSLPPMRFVGDISYSLYLWHWPVMAFWRLERGVELSAAEMAATITLSFLLAILSYRLIERPFLDRTRRVPTRRVLWLAAAGIALVAALGAGAARYGATTQIADPKVRKILSYLDYDFTPVAQKQFASGICMADTYNTGFDVARCATLRPDRPNILVMGDSHAGHVVQAIRERMKAANVMQVTATGCGPLLPTLGAKRCLEVMAIGFAPLPGTGKLDRVILSARWEDGDLPMLLRAIRHFQARDVAVTVLGPAVEYDEPMPRLLARGVMRGDTSMVAASRNTEKWAIGEAMQAGLAGSGATYVSMQDVECPQGVCPLFDSEGGPFHFDYGHYTLAASRTLVNRIPIDALAANRP